MLEHDRYQPSDTDFAAEQLPSPQSRLASKAEAACRYLDALGKTHDDIKAKLFGSSNQQLNDGERTRLRKKLGKEAELLKLAEQAGDLNHGLFCKQATDHVWIAFGLAMRFFCGNPDKSCTPEQIANRVAEVEKRSNSPQPFDKLLLKLIETSPIVGILTLHCAEQILNGNSLINQAAQGNHVEEKTQPVKDWFETSLKAAEAWRQELEQLERLLNSKVTDAQAQRLLGVIKREFNRLWADAVQNLTATAVFIVEASWRPPSEGPPALNQTLTYFPAFPRPQKSKRDEFKDSLTPILQENPAFKNFTGYFNPDFENQDPVHVPFPITPGLSTKFIEKMTAYTQTLRTALESGGAINNDLFTAKKHNLQIVLRPEANAHGQARINILFNKSDFSGFSVRLDLEPQSGSNPRLSFDFGAITWREALDYATCSFRAMKNLPPYGEQLDAQGKLKRERGKTAEDKVINPLIESFKAEGGALSLIAATISSAGYLLGTRKTKAVGHHLRDIEDEITAADFAAGVTALQEALKKAIGSQTPRQRKK